MVVSRRAEPAPWQTIKWDGISRGDWVRALEGADAVINLAGRSVNCRYNAANRREILESRLVTTRLVGDAIARSAREGRWVAVDRRPIATDETAALHEEVRTS